MTAASLHHVSIVTSDLARSIGFYKDNLGFSQIPRPPFGVGGAWLRLSAVDLHLIDHAEGTFRQNPVIDTSDSHFAIRVEDFEDTVRHLADRGFREDAAAGDPKRLLVIRQGVAGFPQAYLLDPDRHMIEINAAR